MNNNGTDRDRTANDAFSRMQERAAAAAAARAAYEARFTGMTFGPWGAAPAWGQLGPEGRAVWERVAQAAIAVALPSLLATLIRRAWRPWRERMHLALPTGARVALLEEVARAQHSVTDGARPVVWREGSRA